MMLRIRSVDGRTHETISNIAKNKGIPITQILEDVLLEIESEIPMELKQPDRNVPSSKQIVIYDADEKMCASFSMTTANLNVDLSTFLKIKIREKIALFPDHLKRTPFKD